MTASANTAYYIEKLYPLQDQVLAVLNDQDTDFYLSGGTAASRGYLNHRFSDDLDLFVNDDQRFGLWSQRLIQALSQQWANAVTVLLVEERFVRLNVGQDGIELKIEMINDVPAHVGDTIDHPVLGRIDSSENILANKITALIGREEPKDLADIWGFCCRMGLQIPDAIENAHSKAAGIFPADLARVLCSVTHEDWQLINWHDGPTPEDFIEQLNVLGEQLILAP